MIRCLGLEMGKSRELGVGSIMALRVLLVIA